MLLDARFEGVVEVRDRQISPGSGRPYYDCALVSDDAQTLYIYEGQLKEVADPDLEVGRRYRVRFRPFINNRWVELKIEACEPVDA